MRGSVYGYVVRATNRSPLTGVTITGSRWEGDSLQSAPYTVALTDDTGRFTFDALREGNWSFRTHGIGGTSGEATVSVFDDAVTEVTIEVGRASDRAWEDLATHPTDRTEPDMRGGVHGYVVRADNGRRLSDATITVVRGTGFALDIAPITDDSGQFFLDGLPEGNWLLRALGAGGETGEATVRVVADAVATVTIEVVDTDEWAVPESE